MMISNPIGTLKRGRRLITLALLFSVMLLAGCGQPETPEQSVIRKVRAMKVGDASALSNRWFPGRAKATREVNLSFRVAGPLIAFPVDVGDEVKQGDVLARIDPRDFEVNLLNAEGQLEQAKATLLRAQSEYNRELNIFKQDPGATSQTNVDRKREERDAARANVKSLEASVSAAQDALSYTYLKAPFHGTVVATYVENFEDVRAKQSIVRVVDTSNIEMIVNIPESLISLSPYVETVRVRFDAFPEREIQGTLKEVGTEASEATRTYPVTLIMAQPEDIKILPGMAGRATAGEVAPEYASQEAGLEVPLSATFSPEERDKTYVWVIDEQKQTVNRREVTTGQLTDRGIRIRAGIEPEEWVATAGVHTLREGQQVKILQEQAE